VANGATEDRPTPDAQTFRTTFDSIAVRQLQPSGSATGPKRKHFAPGSSAFEETVRGQRRGRSEGKTFDPVRQRQLPTQ